MYYLCDNKKRYYNLKLRIMKLENKNDAELIAYHQEEINRLKTTLNKKKELENAEFYMLTVSGEYGSKVRHETYDIAFKEAKRLAKKTNHEVYLMGINSIIQPNNEKVIIKEQKKDIHRVDIIKRILNNTGFVFMTPENYKNSEISKDTDIRICGILDIHDLSLIKNRYNDYIIVFENFSQMPPNSQIFVLENFGNSKVILVDDIENIDSVLLNKMIILK